MKTQIFIISILALIASMLFFYKEIKHEEIKKIAIENPDIKITGNLEETIVEEFSSIKGNTVTAEKEFFPLKKTTTRKYNIVEEKNTVENIKNNKTFYLSGGVGYNFYSEEKNYLWTIEVGKFVGDNFSVGVQYISDYSINIKGTIYF